MKKLIKDKEKMAKLKRLILLGIVLTGSVFLLNFIKSNALKERMKNCDNQIQAIEEDIAEEEQRTIEINNLKKYMTTDAFFEDTARKRLGLIKENEIVFVEKND